MTSIPISEDELTEILIYKLARKRGSLSIDMNHVDVCREVEPQARSLARKMLASELMYEALGETVAQLDHSVPGDCWATGPFTGNPIEDFVVCPGCRAIRKAQSALAAAEKGNA